MAALEDRKPGKVHQVQFLGTGSELFAMHAVNVALTFLTLGVYSCWGRVKLRRYLYAQLEFMGQRFAYHGNGRDLLAGFFLLIVLAAGPLAVIAWMVLQTPPMDPRFVIYGVVGLIYPFAQVGSRRYLLRHLSWSGIRFNFTGSLGSFLWLYFSGVVLCVLTLGLYVPFLQAKLHNYLVAHTSFGTVEAVSTVRGRDLFWHFLKACLLTTFTFGLVWNYYYAKRQQIYMANTRLGDLTFASTMKGDAVFVQRLVNALMLVCTLRLGTPWIQARKLRFITSTTQVIGRPDLAAIRQARAGGKGLDMEVSGDFKGIDLDLGL